MTLSSNVDTATRNNATFGDLTLEGATIQIGRAASTTVNTTRILLRGGAITLTSADGIEIGRFSGAGTFSTNGGVANLTVTASGVLTIAGNITVASTAASGGDILLTGGSIAFGGAARTITGRDITLTGAATGTADLTITTSGTLTLNNNITVTGAVLTLALSGAGAIGDGSSTAVLTASTVRLRQVDVFSGTQSPFTISTSTGSLELTTDAAQVVLDWMIADGRNLTVTSALNVIVRSAIGSGDRNLGNGNLTLTSMTGFVRIFADILTTGNITLSGTGATGINLNSGRAKTLSGAAITLNGNARSNRAVTITASSTLTLNNDITVTGATRTLALRGAGAIVATTGRPRLAASTVRLTQADAFAAGENGIGLFRFRPGSLMLNTDAAQVVHDWMIAPSRDVTITSAGSVRVAAAIGADVPGRNLGVRSLTLVSTGGAVRILADILTTGNITLSGTGTTGINLRSGERTLAGAAITLNGVVASNRAVTITASGILTLNGDITTTGTNALTLMGAMIQIGRRGTDSADRVIELSGGAITLTSAGGIQIGRFNGRGTFFANGIVANLTVTASGVLTIAGNITAAAASGGDIGLTGGSIAFGDAARTITGTAITLTGVATGTADLTITASGTLTINDNIGIGTGALTLRGAGAIVGTGRPRLTASTVSLRQDAAFVGARPFIFGTTTTPIDSLALTTDAAQEVLNWMIIEDTNLTVTSALNVTVRNAIGSGESGRNLGNGNLTLESTGGVVRIMADISTTGDLTLDASTAINLNGGGAKTLTGAIITLSGNARSNRDLTITASGTLTINNDITLTGADLTLTLRGAGAISNGGNVGRNRLTLTAGTVSLRQDAAFVGVRPFNFGTPTTPIGSLALTTDAAQDVFDWMIVANRNLTVTSAGIVRVAAAIGPLEGVRNLGNGDLALESTGGAVRILANISTGGNLALSGVGTAGINFSGGVRILNGADITLTGAARSNRDLTITATGVLTINNNINIGTRALTLTGTSLTFGSSVDLTAGDYIFDPDSTCNTGTMPSCTTVTP